MSFNKNFEVYVKIHPYTNQSEIDKKIQSEKNIKFHFSNNHQQEICKGCDFSINFFRSASIMESLSTNTPLPLSCGIYQMIILVRHIKIMKFLFMLTIKTNFRVY